MLQLARLSSSRYAIAHVFQTRGALAQSFWTEKPRRFTWSATRQQRGGFHKPYNLSKPLADVVGTNQLSRPQVVKALWDYIKAHSLQDPEDKRYIICDAAMKSVFGEDRIHMFTMNKLLSEHLHRQDDA
ncbi:SWIB/MDM2 domain-containing protein [Trichoderma austrokoningii]